MRSGVCGVRGVDAGGVGVRCVWRVGGVWCLWGGTAPVPPMPCWTQHLQAWHTGITAHVPQVLPGSGTCAPKPCPCALPRLSTLAMELYEREKQVEQLSQKLEADLDLAQGRVCAIGRRTCESVKRESGRSTREPPKKVDRRVSSLSHRITGAGAGAGLQQAAGGCMMQQEQEQGGGRGTHVESETGEGASGGPAVHVSYKVGKHRGVTSRAS